MKKALTIYIDDDADLTRICGTFVCEYVCEYGKTTSINMVNCNIKAIDKKCMYFPKVGEAEWFGEVSG